MVRSIPPDVIASWPAPNYIDPVRRGPAAVRVTVAFLVLASVAVFLRLYVHTFVIRCFGTGDVFIILAYLSTIAMTALEIVGYEQYDWGRHVWDVPVENFSRSIYISWWYRIVYSASACFTRMALIFFYYRLTKGGHTAKIFRRWIHIVALFSAAVGLALVLATIFQCAPIRAMWTYPAIPGSKCIDEGRWTFACGILNTIADTCVVVLPIPLIYKLQLPLRKRIGAIMLVSLGLLVCVVGIVRTYYVWLSLVHSYDELWEGYGALVAATIEMHVGLICACAPAIRLGIVKLIKPKLVSICETIPSTSLSPKTVYAKMSTVKGSFDMKSPKQLSRTNSGTFLAPATPGSFGSENDLTICSKSMAYRLENIEEKNSWYRTRPVPPPKDPIYVVKQKEVATSRDQEPDEIGHSFAQRKPSNSKSVNAMTSLRRSCPEEPSDPLSSPPLHPGLRWSPPSRPGEEIASPPQLSPTSSISEFEDTNLHTSESRASSPKYKRPDTLQIPERTFKLARERSLRL